MCKGISSFLALSICPDALRCQPLKYLVFLTIVIRFQHAGIVTFICRPSGWAHPDAPRCDEGGPALYSL
jgi:hypothetical protein